MGRETVRVKYLLLCKSIVLIVAFLLCFVAARGIKLPFLIGITPLILALVKNFTKNWQIVTSHLIMRAFVGRFFYVTRFQKKIEKEGIASSLRLCFCVYA